MVRYFIFWTCICQLFFGCKKGSDSTPPEEKTSIISDNTIIIGSDLAAHLLTIDSASLTFNAGAPAADKIKPGSILVSDISHYAPFGLLRKVTGITFSGGKKILTTENASLADAIVKGSVTYTKDLSDADISDIDSSGTEINGREPQGLSFTFSYDQIIYDADGNPLTNGDQIRIGGEMKLEPSFNFELDIDGNKVKKFAARLTLKNTNKLRAESQVIIASIKKEHVLKTFMLKPFTVFIAGVPIPIAKQWIAIVIGIDGSLGARIVAGAENRNTAIAGLSYMNGAWSAINSQDNNFNFQPLTFQGAARLEPWLQA